jgi:hypothetical protein
MADLEEAPTYGVGLPKVALWEIILRLFQDN